MAYYVSVATLHQLAGVIDDFNSFQSFAFADTCAIVAPLLEEPPRPAPQIHYDSLIRTIRSDLRAFTAEHEKVVGFLTRLYDMEESRVADDTALGLITGEVAISLAYLFGLDFSHLPLEPPGGLAARLFNMFQQCDLSLANAIHDLANYAFVWTFEPAARRLEHCIEAVSILYASQHLFNQQKEFEDILSRLEEEREMNRG